MKAGSDSWAASNRPDPGSDLGSNLMVCWAAAMMRSRGRGQNLGDLESRCID